MNEVSNSTTPAPVPRWERIAASVLCALVISIVVAWVEQNKGLVVPIPRRIADSFIYISRTVTESLQTLNLPNLATQFRLILTGIDLTVLFGCVAILPLAVFRVSGAGSFTVRQFLWWLVLVHGALAPTRYILNIMYLSTSTYGGMRETYGDWLGIATSPYGLSTLPELSSLAELLLAAWVLWRLRRLRKDAALSQA